MLGDKIKSLRKKMGWSTRELAEKSGVSLVTISKGENGKSALTPKILRKLSVAFQVPFEELYNPVENVDYLQENLIDDKNLLEKLKYLHLLSLKEKEVLETILDSFLFRQGVDAVSKNFKPK